MESHRPDYKRIFKDIILDKCPERSEEFEQYLIQDHLSAIDIININKKIFGVGNKETLNFNQKHRSYDKQTIMMMLNYQKKQKLSNGKLANHFQMSRNTVAKWKKLYLKLCK